MPTKGDFLSPSQIEDYESSFSKRNPKDDFELLQDRAMIAGTAYDAHAGTATVRRKSNGVTKAYVLKSGTTWPMEFIADLRTGFFD